MTAKLPRGIPLDVSGTSRASKIIDFGRINVKVSFSDLYATNQTVEEDVIHRIRELIRSSKFIGGEDLDKFEEEFAAYAQMRFCAGCANGTDALLVALKGLNIGHGAT